MKIIKKMHIKEKILFVLKAIIGGFLGAYGASLFNNKFKHIASPKETKKESNK